MKSRKIPSATKWAVTLLAFSLIAASCQATSQPSQGPIPEMRLLDLAGDQVNPFSQDPASACQPSPAAAVLVLFVRSDCPISNRYAPELQRIYERFSPQGVRFWLAFADKDEPAAAIQQHLQDFRLPGCVLRDPNHDLVGFAAATITPEAAVFSPQGELLYRGRIDDRYVDFGKARAAPSKRDLEEALEAIVQGKPVAHPRTQAVGCYLSDLK